MLTYICHHITEGQYIPIKACTCMYMDETGHISNKPHNNTVLLQWGNKGGEGEGEVYMYTRVATCLNAKKGGETSKSKILRILKRGI